MRRQFTAEQKAAVALAALRGDKTINQVASVHWEPGNLLYCSQMKKVETITIAKQQSYNLTAQGVVLTFLAVAIFQTLVGNTTQSFSVWAYVMAYILTIIVHEAIHGVGFMLGGAKPHFGVSVAGILPVAYATSDEKLPLKNMLVVAYLPFVVLSVLFIALSFVFPRYQPLFMVGFVGNFAGAIGDIWIASKLLKYLRHKDTRVLDTKTGTEVYSNSADALKLGQKSQAKLQTSSSFGKVALISFFCILALQMLIPILLAVSAYNGVFHLGSDAFYLLKVDRSGDNASMELNLLAPILGSVLAGAIYTLIERHGRNNGQ